jgi:hypothetical protein
LFYVESSINTTLQTALVAKDLLEEDYDKWMAKVKQVAGKVEDLPLY